MSQDFDLVEIGFKVIEGITALFVSVGAWLWTNLVKDMRDMQAQINKHDTDLLSYKLESEKNFASKIDMQGTLSRLHDRIDIIDQKIDDRFSEVGRDIKTILGKI